MKQSKINKMSKEELIFQIAKIDLKLSKWKAPQEGRMPTL